MESKEQEMDNSGEIVKGASIYMNWEGHAYHVANVCPICKRSMPERYPYCPYCGQPLDWSEVK